MNKPDAEKMDNKDVPEGTPLPREYQDVLPLHRHSFSYHTC